MGLWLVMKFKDTNLQTYQKYRTQLRSMMGCAGISGLLEILADLSQDFGDSHAFLSSDPFWLNAAAQIDECREKVEDVL